ncbi:MAG: serine hydrolase [Gemmatimonadota bacterium]
MTLSFRDHPPPGAIDRPAPAAARARWFTLLCLMLLHPVGLVAQNSPAHEKADRRLQQQLDALVKGFHGDAGIYVRHLRTGRSAAIRENELFPTASMIKVPILIAMHDAIKRGELAFNQQLLYRDSLLYEGDDILGSFRDSTGIALGRVLMLMITMSDNTAALWNQRMAGSGTAINDWLSSHGFDSTRVNSRTPGRQGNWQNYGWGQTTPREMANLLVMIRENRAVSPAASEEMYRALTHIYWNGEALSQLPPWVQAASKQGDVDQSRSEVVLVNAPSGDYVFCIITSHQVDESWEHDNEGWVLIRRLSALLWKYFEPEHPWTAAPGAERLKPQ